MCQTPNWRWVARLLNVLPQHRSTETKWLTPRSTDNASATVTAGALSREKRSNSSLSPLGDRHTVDRVPCKRPRMPATNHNQAKLRCHCSSHQRDSQHGLRIRARTDGQETLHNSAHANSWEREAFMYPDASRWLPRCSEAPPSALRHSHRYSQTASLENAAEHASPGARRA